MTGVEPDFNDLVDNVLVACADAQVGDRIIPCDVYETCKTVYPACPPTWLEMAFSRLVELGYGKKTTDYARPAARLFKINGNGVARAAEVRKSRTQAAPSPTAVIHNNVTMSPTFNSTNAIPPYESAKSVSVSGILSAWGTWVGVAVAIATLLWMLHEAKVF